MPRCNGTVVVMSRKVFERRTLEAEFGRQLRELPGETVEAEYAFHSVRKWRADYALLRSRVLIEVQGIGPSGAHGSAYIQLEKDAEKYSTAAGLGWRMIFCTHRQIRSGQAIQWVKEAYRYGLDRDEERTVEPYAAEPGTGHAID